MVYTVEWIVRPRETLIWMVFGRGPILTAVQGDTSDTHGTLSQLPNLGCKWMDKAVSRHQNQGFRRQRELHTSLVRYSLKSSSPPATYGIDGMQGS